MKKNLFYFLLAALCTVSFTACSSDDNGDGEMVASPSWNTYGALSLQ